MRCERKQKNFLKLLTARNNSFFFQTVVGRPSVPRYLLVLLQSHRRLMLIILTEVIVLNYTYYHAERVHSLLISILFAR